MQTAVVHQRKAYIPWIPMLVAALLVVASAFAVQLAIRDRGTTVAPPSTEQVDHGADQQKAAMAEAGITGVGVAPHGVQTSGDLQSVSGPHPRTKFGASDGTQSDLRDPALRATIARIEQAR
jgi:hypothetical protein